jgi:integrase
VKIVGQGSKHAGIERYKGPEGVTYTARASKRLPSGKRIFWRETFKAEREAIQARRAWLAEQDSGTAIAPNKVTLLAAIRTWLETYPRTKAKKTEVEYIRTVENHILPSPLVHLPVQQLDAGRIQDWYNSLDVGARTMELIHQRLCQILDMAVDHKRIKDNPARRCHVPKSQPRRGIALTKEQVERFLTLAADDFFAPLWHVDLATGLRRGEVLGVRWRDIDWGRGTLSVRHTVIWVDAPFPQERTKTPSSTRAVKLDPDTLAQLRAHQARQGTIRLRAEDRWEEHDLVFCTRHGKPLGPNNVYKHFKALLEQAGLPTAVTIHDLRRTHVSYLLNNGVPLTTVARRGGWRNASVLLRTYAEAYDEQDARAADVAGALTSSQRDKALDVQV